MPDENTTTEATAQTTTADEPAENTGANGTGAGTQPAQQTTEAQSVEKTFTQAEVDKMFQNRRKSAVKAELRKLTGETDGTPTVEELSKQLSEERTARQTLEAR